MLTGFADGAVLGERYGEGDVSVVALHGWQRTHRDFATVLAGGPGAVALDLPGFGATPPPPDPWGSAAYADAVTPVLEALGGPVVVVGHSFGGRVAIQLALAAPDRVRALVLCGVPQIAPTATTGRPNPIYRAIRAARRFGLVSEARLDRARRGVRLARLPRSRGRAARRARGRPRRAVRAAPARDRLPGRARLGRARHRRADGERDLAHDVLASSTLTILDGVGPHGAARGAGRVARRDRPATAMTTLDGVALGISALGALFGILRWLRVAQREHYLAGSCFVFAARWWRATPANNLAALVAVAGLVVGVFHPWISGVTGIVVIFAPFGLSVRGRSSKLAWTRTAPPGRGPRRCCARGRRGHHRRDCR